ncbi:MAG: hypothetical protein IJO27_03840 [Bacilli bacterium]|nr:hypothetical protein [Erysipelotrichaceae bacterium]MBQ6817543.1 hypothetical protein [Bacilli bacterium]
MTIRISERTIDKLASDGKINEGTELVKLKELTIEFLALPKNVEDLKLIDRSGDNGKFVVVALLLASLKTWKKEDEETCSEMMKELLNSPTIPNNYSNFTKSFVKDRMLQNDKYDFLADAYFDGACPDNGYTPNSPLSITLREYPYAPQLSTMYGPNIYVEKIVSDFKGVDSERSVSVYKDPKDNKWYIWSDSYKSLLVDIKPIIK